MNLNTILVQLCTHIICNLLSFICHGIRQLITIIKEFIHTLTGLIKARTLHYRLMTKEHLGCAMLDNKHPIFLKYLTRETHPMLVDEAGRIHIEILALFIDWGHLDLDKPHVCKFHDSLTVWEKGITTRWLHTLF